MTGKAAPPDLAGVQTFSERQSSLFGNFPAGKSCEHASPNWSVRRTPSQRRAGRGGVQRSFPTGGSAYGIPLKTVIAGSLPVVPSTKPASVRIGAFTSAKHESASELAKIT